MPYARSLPRATINKVRRVPGNPKMKLTTFQNVVPFACALIPAKLRLAKIQTAETPPSVPVGLDEDPSIDLATAANAIKAVPKQHSRGIQFLNICGGKRNMLFICIIGPIREVH